MHIDAPRRRVSGFILAELDCAGGSQATSTAHGTGAVGRSWAGSNMHRERNRIREALAELTGVNSRTVQKIEAGDINILVTTVIRVKQALRYPWDRLLP